MEQAYWLRRKHEELALVECATCPEAKRAHFDLARRYSVKAGEALRPEVANIASFGELDDARRKPKAQHGLAAFADSRPRSASEIESP